MAGKPATLNHEKGIEEEGVRCRKGELFIATPINADEEAWGLGSFGGLWRGMRARAKSPPRGLSMPSVVSRGMPGTCLLCRGGFGGARLADQVTYCVWFERRGEKVALAVIAVERLELEQLLAALDSFSDHLHVQIFSQQEDGADGFRGSARLRHVHDKRTVDFQDIEGKAAETFQGSVSGAEIVDLQTYAERLQAIEQGRHGIEVVHQNAFGN